MKVLSFRPMDSPYQEDFGLDECVAFSLMCRTSLFPEKIIVTSPGDCRMDKAPPKIRSKPGTPAAMQDEREVKANLPFSTSSLSFFMMSLAHCLRFGLLMSLMRWVGCFPGVPLGM